MNKYLLVALFGVLGLFQDVTQGDALAFLLGALAEQHRPRKVASVTFSRVSAGNLRNRAGVLVVLVKRGVLSVKRFFSGKR